MNCVWGFWNWMIISPINLRRRGYFTPSLASIVPPHCCKWIELHYCRLRLITVIHYGVIKTPPNESQGLRQSDGKGEWERERKSAEGEEEVWRGRKSGGERVEKHIEHIPNELKNVHLVLFGNEQSLDIRQGRRVGVQNRFTVCGSSIKIVILSSIFIRSLINHNRLRRRGREKWVFLLMNMLTPCALRRREHMFLSGPACFQD